MIKTSSQESQDTGEVMMSVDTQDDRRLGASGFTLIELLIVIVILGILAGIVVFAVGSARSDSVNSACKADVKSVNTAAEAYKASNGSYPAQADLPLRSYPTSGEYTITYTEGTGTAVGTVTGGAAC